MSLATVYRALNSADAQLIRSRLEAANLHPIVSDELASLSIEGYSLTTGGIRVQVPESEAASARELIENPGTEPE
jgi:hypothetical protein